MGPLIVIGASARAAAFSALRAGFQPWCIDLFADRDLAERCPAVRIPGDCYPAGFVKLLEAAPDAPWLYTGGLENHPDLVDELARRRPLWGNAGKVLRRVRDPFQVRSALGAAGLPTPDLCNSPHLLPTDGTWLRKPLRGSGGIGIESWTGQERAKRPVYYQQMIQGETCSAVYVAGGGQARLLGVTRQLVGEPWLNAGRFRYAGSIGPLPLAVPAADAFEHLGRTLAGAFDLCGLFGVDAILREGLPYCVEVNPRYPASVEVLEHALGFRAMQLHAAACASGGVAGTSPRLVAAAATVGKAIVFARHKIRFPELGPWDRCLQEPAEVLKGFADVPAPGTAIETGWPILTLFYQARDMESCWAGLRESANALDRLLYPK